MPELTNTHTFTLDELQNTLQSTKGPVLVDFWEPRCSACRATLDAIDELACRVQGHGVVGTFNVRKNPEVVRSLGVETVPTLILFRDGYVESVLQGAEKIQTFVDRIDEEVFFGQPPSCER